MTWKWLTIMITVNLMIKVMIMKINKWITKIITLLLLLTNSNNGNNDN